MSLPSLQQFHKTPYPTISPKRLELSQDERTVVITGGNGGIGYSIARGFITANAKRVIIIGRRPAVVGSAVARLVEEAKRLGSQSAVDGRVCDISNLTSAAAFWTGLHKDGIFVNVLVLNAAASGPATPILEADLDDVWATFEANVRSTLDFTRRFYKQSGIVVDSHEVKLTPVNQSNVGPAVLTYGLAKVSGKCFLMRRLYVEYNGTRATLICYDQKFKHSSRPTNRQRHKPQGYANH
jgi:NAD(P)-dependent dehydrogenase (short-subunit alcohol dehydrogenase family)